jgi:hypothetical protein
MKKFKESKKILIDKGIYKNAIHTDSSNQSIYITIPYGAIKNGGVTKIYKRPTNLNFNRIVKFWIDSVDINKNYTY